MKFVNQELDRLGLSVQNLDTQVGMRLRGPGSGRATGRGLRRAHPGAWPTLCDPGCVSSQTPGSSSPMGMLHGGSIANQGQDSGPVK